MEWLREQIYNNFIADNRWRYLTNGLKVTLEVTFFAVLIGIVLGLLVAVVRSTYAKTGKMKIGSFLCGIYITVIRGTPVVVQLLIIYFVVFGSVKIDKVLVAIMAFGLNSGAYVAEIFRSGIMSIDNGQFEAGRSLGFSYGKTMLYIIMPQAFKNVLPALGNDVSWSVAFSMYSVILGHLGTDAVAANSLVTVVRNIGSVFCFAIASAGTILLGNVMGKGDLEKSKVYASRMLKMTVIAGAIGGVIVLTITPFVMRFASLNDQAMHYLKYMLLINTYYIMGSAVNTALIAGVFRAGGDTKFGLICDTIDMWVYAVPLGFFAAFVLKLPVLWVYFLLCTDEFVKWPWVLHHYRQGKWAQNITRENLFD